MSTVATNVKHVVPKVIFLAHWIESWNWLLHKNDHLHKHPEDAHRWWYWAPVYYVMSIAYLLGAKSYDIVDRFTVNNACGETWLVRNFAWHFLNASWREQIRQRIFAAVIDAQNHGATVLGFGALTKAEWLTHGGKDVVDALGTRLKIPLVHGDTLTAAVVIMQVEQLLKVFEPYAGKVFITGATSKIGRAIVLDLARKGCHVYMYSESRERFDDIRAEAGSAACRIFHAQKYSDGRNVHVWITGKAEKGAGEKMLEEIPLGAAVLNFSVPDPITPRLLKRRPDLHHFDGGLMQYDPTQITIRFTMRLKPGVTYACHAGTMVHGLERWTHHEVGPVDMEFIWHVWECAKKHGFALPRWTSHFEPVTLPGQMPLCDERDIG